MVTYQDAINHPAKLAYVMCRFLTKKNLLLETSYIRRKQMLPPCIWWQHVIGKTKPPTHWQARPYHTGGIRGVVDVAVSTRSTLRASARSVVGIGCWACSPVPSPVVGVVVAVPSSPCRARHRSLCIHEPPYKQLLVGVGRVRSPSPPTLLPRPLGVVPSPRCLYRLTARCGSIPRPHSSVSQLYLHPVSSLRAVAHSGGRGAG